MSSEVIYKCDHCNTHCSGEQYASIGRWDESGIIALGKTVHGCSKEHLGIALAKMFGIGINGETDELLNRKRRELTKLADANNFLIIERDNMRARVAELEARTPANEVINAERVQYETTIELQRKRIEELETLEAVSIERLARIEEPAQRLVAIDNELAEGRDAAAKASFHDSVMRPIEELRVYFGNIARTEKRGQTLFDREVERRKRAESGRDELHDRVAELEKRIAKLTAPVTVDGKTPGEVLKNVYMQLVGSGVVGCDADAIAAQAVLRVFGQPSQTAADAADALRRVRVEFVRFAADARMPGPLGTQYTINEILAITLNIIDAQLAKIEPELEERRSDHVHEPQKRFKYERAWLSEQTDDALFDLYMEHVGFFDMNGTMVERANMIETLAAIEQEQAITLPTKPTKPLRARLEELATYWEKGAASSSMSEGYRQASKDCAKELREVIDDPR